MTISKRIRRSSRGTPTHSNLISLAVAAALLSTAAHGQTAAPTTQASGALEEIIVTATRRESNLQSTPIAVTAVDASLIESMSPRTIADLALMVPNFSANKVNGFNAASFAMRGVGNTDIIVYNEAPVAVLIDDFVMPSTQTQLLDPFDVQEIEVLRGPQGTLFGKNTTGGAIVVKTKAPLLDQTTFEAQGGGRQLQRIQRSGRAQRSRSSITNSRCAWSRARRRQQGWMRNGAVSTVQGTTYHGRWPARRRH